MQNPITLSGKGYQLFPVVILQQVKHEVLYVMTDLLTTYVALKWPFYPAIVRVSLRSER